MPDSPPGCLFGPRQPLLERDGELQEVETPDWANGIDIRHAGGSDRMRLLELADGDPDRLREIQIARGYKAGWVHYAMLDAAAKRGAA